MQRLVSFSNRWPKLLRFCAEAWRLGVATSVRQLQSVEGRRLRLV
jgi:hypothetical protein